MLILITKAEELIQISGINLKELAGQLDCLMEEWSYFANKVTYEIISIEDRYLGYAGEPEEIPDTLADWERNEVERASSLIDRWDDLIPLSSRYDINEYSLMENFIGTIDDVHTRNCLCVAIEGRGAFRRFKDTARTLGVIDAWYHFKGEALLVFAKDWCKGKGLPYNID